MDSHKVEYDPDRLYVAIGAVCNKHPVVVIDTMEGSKVDSFVKSYKGVIDLPDDYFDYHEKDEVEYKIPQDIYREKIDSNIGYNPLGTCQPTLYIRIKWIDITIKEIVQEIEEIIS